MNSITETASLVPLLFLLLCVELSISAEIRINIPNGTVVGQEFTNDNFKNWKGYEFLGIPFAEPPIGNLRFAKPQPLKKKWSKPFMANKPGNRCPQPPMPELFPPHMLSLFKEDCLNLNIWTPLDAINSPRAVMVWIHDGGYLNGEGYPKYNSRALSVLGDVVVVTIQYRLGVLGFLRLGTSVGGNWAMWDQQLALRWVHENIHKFGGDPTKVTIFGQSSGAASVGLQLLNKESASYFNRAILQSGAPTAVWAANPNTEAVTANHLQFARHAKCTQKDMADILTCMRKRTVKEILEATNTYFHLDGAVMDWQPVVDGDFLVEPPEKTYRDRSMIKKDLLMGVNKDEAGLSFYYRVSSMKYLFKVPDVKALMIPPVYNKFVNFFFLYDPYYPTKLPPEAIRIIQTYGTSATNPNNADLNTIRAFKLFSDSRFICPVNQMADTYMKMNSTIYFYQFNHRPSTSRYPKFINATHADEIPFVFGSALTYGEYFPYTPDELKLSKAMLADWASFAKTGKPVTSNWKRFTAEKKEYYKFDIPSSSAAENGVNREDCKFWTTVIPTVSEMAQKLNPKTKAERDSGCEPLNLVGKILLGVLCAVVAVGTIFFLCLSYHRKK